MQEALCAVLLLTASESFAATHSITTAEHVEGSSYGLIGDGKTDNTDAFRRLLGTGKRTIHIAAGDYVTGKLTIPRDTILELDRGVILRDSGKLAGEDRVISILEGDAQINGRGAKIVSNRRDYTSGEQRHGLFIYGASNVLVDGLESSANGGDGFYIGGPAGKPSQDVTLRNCAASNNRRQGLSITAGRRIEVIDCLFDHTVGTAPEYGIDLEPDLVNDPLDHIRIVRPRTEANRGGGILIVLGALNETSEPVDISITDHVSVDERRPEVRIDGHGVRATVKYNLLK
jgi:hypothetical protein